MSLKIRFPRFLQAAVIPLLMRSQAASGAGFTDPPIILYGSVTQSADGYSVPLKEGSIRWTVTPAGGTPFVLVTTLAEISGTVNYRLEIPVEKVPAGFKVSPATISGSAATQSLTRSVAMLPDGTALSILSAESGSEALMEYSENKRGLVERVNLGFDHAFKDSDGDGLPDWFEEQHPGLNKLDASDAPVAADSHGRLYSRIYSMHLSTRPQEAEYRQWAVDQKLPGGADAPFDGDPEGDGVVNLMEFALGTNPMERDLPLNQARRTADAVAINSRSHLMMTVVKPEPQRSSLQYVVEASRDLRTWQSEEGVNVVTVADSDSVLQVRSTASFQNSIEDSAARARRGATYLRLRIAFKP